MIFGNLKVKVKAKFKRFIRRKYLFSEYKDKKNGDMIYITSNDRQLGLTTMMIKDVLKNDYVLIVSNDTIRKFVAHEMYKMSRKFSNTLLKNIPVCTEQEYYRHYTESIQSDFHGVRYKCVIDNSISHNDLLHYSANINSLNIINGFVTMTMPQKYGRLAKYE